MAVPFNLYALFNSLEVWQGPDKNYREKLMLSKLPVRKKNSNNFYNYFPCNITL